MKNQSKNLFIVLILLGLSISSFAQKDLSQSGELKFKSRQELEGKLNTLDTTFTQMKDLLQFFVEEGIEIEKEGENRFRFYVKQSAKARENLLGLYDYSGMEIRNLKPKDRKKILKALETANIPFMEYEQKETQTLKIDIEHTQNNDPISLDLTNEPVIRVILPEEKNKGLIRIALENRVPEQEIHIDSLGRKSLIINLEKLNPESRAQFENLILIDSLSNALKQENLSMEIVEISTFEPGNTETETSLNISSITMQEARELLVKGINPQKKLVVKQLRIYPTDDNGKMRIEFNSEGEGKLYVNLMDAKGRWVFQEERKNFNGLYRRDINLMRRIRGKYYLFVELGDSGLVKKLNFE